MKHGFAEEFLGYLNLIHHLSASENAKKTQSMLQKVVSLVKYKYLRQDELITLKEELLHTDLLLDLFLARFGDHLKVTRDIEGETGDIYIPIYTVAGFVENALFHGLIPKEGNWELKLEVQQDANNIIVLIKDNGVGFETPVLECVDDASEEAGGIPQVTARFRACFHDAGTIQIQSRRGKGTNVIITVPKWNSGV